MKLHRPQVPWLDIFLILLSATFLTLMFPKFEVYHLAWFALVPLLLVIRTSGPWRALLSSLATGFLFYGVSMSWMLRLSGLNPFNFFLMILGSAWYMGAFGLSAYYFQKHLPRWNMLTFPAAWVILEYIRGHLGFLSVPWGILGYSQYTVLSVARFSAFTGVYGVSFLIVTVNTVLSDIILYCLSLFRVKGFRKEPSLANLKTSASMLGGALTMLLASFLYGLSPVSEIPRPSSLSVAIVQGNLYSHEKVDEGLIEKVVGKYRDLALSASASRPDLITWPSSSVPGRIPFDPKLVSMLSDTARKTDSFLLVGTSRFDKFNPAQKKQKRVSNSAFLFSPQGKILGKYDKIKLLPFDQYLPLRRYVNWPSWLVSSGVTDHEPGKELTLFRMDNLDFGVQICWENMFPDQFREMAAKGIDFMVSMTNEGFIDLPVAHYQLLAMNVFRAIENHIAIVRPAATGVSCIIEPDGRIMARVSDVNGADVNIEGYQVARISPSRERTFYTRFGDVFIYILSFSLIGLILGTKLSKNS